MSLTKMIPVDWLTSLMTKDGTFTERVIVLKGDFISSFDGLLKGMYVVINSYLSKARDYASLDKVYIHSHTLSRFSGNERYITHIRSIVFRLLVSTEEESRYVDGDTTHAYIHLDFSPGKLVVLMCHCEDGLREGCMMCQRIMVTRNRTYDFSLPARLK